MIYVTHDADRWDTIAYEMYGDAKRYPELIEANPEYRTVLIFEAGVELEIPEIYEDETIKEVNAPWVSE